eukprot:gb/GEZJ01007291.1/.p1 GENE.gb/GEZJ01007291.1/~~gb/GEZJ01007291.1/.p1  ORF type:complete len:175 (+),score=3.22 gb/GEZJ01007291.1/:388-912(+)
MVVIPNVAYVSSGGVIRTPSCWAQQRQNQPAELFGRHLVENVEYFVRAPQFNPVANRHDALMRQYVHSGYFSKILPKQRIQSDDWASYSAFLDNVIAQYFTATLFEARTGFCNLIYQLCNWFISTGILPQAYEQNTWKGHTCEGATITVELCKPSEPEGSYRRHVDWPTSAGLI